MATNIKDKIAKLLALAESPNENEARAALLAVCGHRGALLLPRLPDPEVRR